MILKKIVLKDFRQYKGTQEIKFSTNSEKNVTVILGLNTSGKTTIIEAFKWCLYESTTYSKRDLINVETVNTTGSGQEMQMYVEITLIHAQTEYIIKRSQFYSKNTNQQVSVSQKSILSLSYKEKSGGLKSIRANETQDIINTILPSELSDYFFFDGERIGDIGNSVDIRKAVQGLMGLDVITEAKNRLDPKRKNSVTSRFEEKLDIGSTKDSEALTNDISEQQDKLENYKKTIRTVEDELKSYTMKFRQVSDKIAANQSVKEKQNERAKLEISLDSDKNRLIELNNRIRKNFSKRSSDFFAIPLMGKAKSILENTKEEIAGISGMTAEAINKILERGTCICGIDLENNSHAIEKILDEKKLLPPYHIGTMVNETKTSYKYIEDRGFSFKQDLMSDSKRYEELRKEISDKQKQLENISKSLEGNLNVGELEIVRNKYKDKIKDLENRRDNILLKIGSTDKAIDLLKKRKESLTIASKRNEEVYKCIAYSKALFDIFTESYTTKEKTVKESLEKNVNEMFKNIYHGQRYVRISDDYKVSLDTKVSNEMIETDMSKGLEAVKNFSFVAGLVKIAKEKVKDNEEIPMEEPYPLVMDAPFSNVDEIHIARISKVLPEVSEQVIWILMEKDWNYAKESLNEKVGYIYDIEKVNNSETFSIVKGRESNV